MLFRFPALMLCSLPLLAGCGETHKNSVTPTAMSRQQFAEQPARAATAQRAASEAPAKRYIAVRQFLIVEVSSDLLDAMQKAAIEKCQAPVCEVLESTLSRRSEHEPARATLRLRIEPAALPGFLSAATRGGEIIEQRTESEDKTEQVIDTEARLRNLGELRERLRKLLKSEGAKLKDVIEIERELARVQTELESAQGQLKLLAAETSRSTVNLEWRARRSVAEEGTFNALARALGESGRTLADSLAALVTFLVAALPWLVVLAGIAFPVRAWWRRRKAAMPTP
jgi:hypothetical protein